MRALGPGSERGGDALRAPAGDARCPTPLVSRGRLLAGLSRGGSGPCLWGR